MTVVKLSRLTMKRRTLLPFLDFSGFFMFFGITGMPGARQYRLNRRFDEEYYSYLVKVQAQPVSGQLEAGIYRLDGLPDEVNKRGWTAHRSARVATALTLTTAMSEDGWHDLQAWYSRSARTVQPVRISDLPPY